MRSLFALLAAGAAFQYAKADATQDAFDCSFRDLILERALAVQPHLTQQQLQEMADALNGTPEKPVGCTAKPPSATNKNAGAPRFSVPSDSTVTIYADAKHGSDSNKGTQSSPVKSLHHAVELSRSAGVGNPRTVVLREGYYYLPQALSLTQEDSGLTVQNYNGEEADIAGSAPLSVDWSEYNVSSAAAAYYAEKHPELYAEPAWGAGGQWVESPDTDAMQYAAPNATSNQGHMGSAGDCEAACQANYTKAQKDGGIACTIWTYHNGGDCYFRTDNTWKPVQEYGETSGRYLPPPPPPPPANIWKASISTETILPNGIMGIRLSGARAVRARYPNNPSPERLGFGSLLTTKTWLAPETPKNPDIQFAPSTPFRNNSGMFSTYKLGVGGVCERFTPAAGYWCNNDTAGGGAFTYRVPAGFQADTSILPHQPYKTTKGGIIQTWRPGHWSSWMGELSRYDPDNNTFWVDYGFFQGARGANTGDVFFIENVFEELDYPDEFFYDTDERTLYLWHNGTGAPPSSKGQAEGELPSLAAPTNKVLVDIAGSKNYPVRDITFRGVTFRDTAYTYMDAHSMPSGGDWGLQRTAAVQAEGTEGLTIDSCMFTRLDGNALLLSAYNRDASITKSQFEWNGDTCIALWGNGEGAPEGAPGFGPSLMSLDIPMNTTIDQCLFKEFGVHEKQSSAIFYAKAGHNKYTRNIVYNGPRAHINQNDGGVGGDLIESNVLWNSCRESGDHALFNSWDRQVYEFPDENGQPTTLRPNTIIRGNIGISNYNSDALLDNDDGSRRFLGNNNSQYLGHYQLKNDFSGSLNNHASSFAAYVGEGMTAVKADPCCVDHFTNMTIVLSGTGNYWHGTCAPSSSANILGDNRVFAANGDVTECGMSVADYQSKYNADLGTKTGPIPSAEEMIAMAKEPLTGY